MAFTSRGLLAAVTVGVVVAYAALSGLWVGHEPGWYASLPRPAWQPPDWVFGVMWPLNFLALAVAGLAVALSTPLQRSLPVVALLVASSGFALGWAYTFYVPHALGAASVCLGVAAVLAWTMALAAGRALPWAGWALVPYAVWLTVATSLAVGYWRST